MGWFNMGFKTRKEETKMMNHDFFLRNVHMLLQEKLNRGGRFPNVSRIFSLTELHEATNNFDTNMVIGKTGFATVFKGFLPDNREIVIKKSKDDDLRSMYQFINEILVLSRFHHKNVVKLIGYCLETEVPLIVFESINGTHLNALLHNPENMGALDWNLRLKIAIETANMLSYLHSVPPTPIVHRDVKPFNILIDHDFTVKVTDFGCSVVFPVGDQNEISEELIIGTMGYIDPEYSRTNKLTEKSDVYSFGVVLVELLTRMKAVAFYSKKDRSLVSLFIRRLEEERLFEIVDETIVSDGNREQITEYSKLAQACLNFEGQDRPSMKEVAIVLEGLRFGGLQMEAAAIILGGLRFNRQQSADEVDDSSSEYLDDDDIEGVEYLDDDTEINEELVDGI